MRCEDWEPEADEERLRGEDQFHRRRHEIWIWKACHSGNAKNLRSWQIYLQKIFQS